MTIGPLIVDRYPLDGAVDAKALMDAGAPWHGLCLKLCQGTNPAYASGAWCKRLFDVCRLHPRWNVDFWGRLYVYPNFRQDGRVFADYCWSLIRAWQLQGHGFLPVMIDVERGGEDPSSLTRDNVEAVVGAFAERYLELAGAPPTLYGHELLLSLGIASKMGCDRVSVARYTPTLPLPEVQRMGWDYADEWQYCGTDAEPADELLAGYPTRAPGCAGLSDISVVVTRGDALGSLAKLAA